MIGFLLESPGKLVLEYEAILNLFILLPWFLVLTFHIHTSVNRKETQWFYSIDEATATPSKLYTYPLSLLHSFLDPSCLYVLSCRQSI